MLAQGSALDTAIEIEDEEQDITTKNKRKRKGKNEKEEDEGSGFGRMELIMEKNNNMMEQSTKEIKDASKKVYLVSLD